MSISIEKSWNLSCSSSIKLRLTSKGRVKKPLEWRVVSAVILDQSVVNHWLRSVYWGGYIGPWGAWLIEVGSLCWKVHWILIIVEWNPWGSIPHSGVIWIPITRSSKWIVVVIPFCIGSVTSHMITKWTTEHWPVYRWSTLSFELKSRLCNIWWVFTMGNSGEYISLIDTCR